MAPAPMSHVPPSAVKTATDLNPRREPERAGGEGGGGGGVALEQALRNTIAGYFCVIAKGAYGNVTEEVFVLTVACSLCLVA